ncbi:hydroxypyruvate isomerase [Amycolatopsis sp. AA4]|uniref:hydroxypyruvate isomerase family protein n=1 Tax=Actinomycetes TaxID=1760 RepID=UPI0001B53A9E|nr:MULTISPECIES: TIM barrel protein [Actinomycetes]ATY12459.1 hydroxypyruvate isomerase [Amycolatopsis sp. AA4]EFL08241.1 hydroxypyruvate isomerase [Streptomyces sp. AA4]
MTGPAGERHSLPYTANLSILFTELPLLERAQAARAAGFTKVEYWWPFDSADPSGADVDRFARSIEEAGVQLTGLNFYAGDMAAGERGLVSWVGREAEFATSLTVALGLAERLGCRSFNALYGNRIDGVAPSEQDDLARTHLATAAKAAEGIGAQLVLEPLSGTPAYPLKTAADAVAVLDELGLDNVRLLADLYHLAVNGDDLDTVIARCTPRTGHVQIADAPGRHQPGTGELDLEGYLEKLQAAGYAGPVGVEYKPDGSTVDSLAWLPYERRGN